jgi:hypothetical protein
LAEHLLGTVNCNLTGCLYVSCDVISEQQSAGLENKIISLQQKLTEAKEENKQLRVQVRYILLLPSIFNKSWNQIRIPS